MKSLRNKNDNTAGEILKTTENTNKLEVGEKQQKFTTVKRQWKPGKHWKC